MQPRHGCGVPKEAEAGQVIGIDVSHHQGKIDWNEVSRNVGFAYIRCAYGTKPDRLIQQNLDASRGLLLRGVYQYYVPTETAEAQANVAMSYHDDGVELPLVLDVEHDDLWIQTTPQRIASDVEEWVKRVLDWGAPVMLYTNASTWALLRPFVDDWVYSSCYLWQAAWYPWQAAWRAEKPKPIDPWKQIDVWQYTNVGVCPGIKGHVDLNEASMWRS
ncbi:MAG: hypothetical protein EOM24_12325 [Chloroflexia bacterium]|nr:hypothetical protein [Chloroflexia bacterium]